MKDTLIEITTRCFDLVKDKKYVQTGQMHSGDFLVMRAGVGYEEMSDDDKIVWRDENWLLGGKTCVAYNK